MIDDLPPSGHHSDEGRPTVRAAMHTLSTLLSRDWFPSRDPDVDGAYYGPKNRKGVPPRCDAWRGLSGNGASIFLVHGGGFLIGHRRMKAMRLLATHYANRGIHVCSVDYRLLFRGGCLQKATDDVADALDWWAKDPMGWGVSASRIGVISMSAGAALALLATGRNAVPVARIVGIFGIYDFRTLRGRLAGWVARKLVGADDLNVLEAKSPCFNSQPIAPMLLLHGTNDSLVPVEQAHHLKEVRSRSKLETIVSIYEGAPHAFLNWEGPHAVRALRELDEFLSPVLTASTESELG